MGSLCAKEGSDGEKVRCDVSAAARRAPCAYARAAEPAAGQCDTSGSDSAVTRGSRKSCGWTVLGETEDKSRRDNGAWPSRQCTRAHDPWWSNVSRHNRTADTALSCTHTSRLLRTGTSRTQLHCLPCPSHTLHRRRSVFHPPPPHLHGPSGNAHQTAPIHSPCLPVPCVVSLARARGTPSARHNVARDVAVTLRFVRTPTPHADPPH